QGAGQYMAHSYEMTFIKREKPPSRCPIPTMPHCDLRDYLEKLPPSSPLVCLQPHGTNPPFFCVHPAEGDVMCYANLARHFPADQPFCGIQAECPNRVRATASSIESMARRYVEQLRELQPQGPYCLGGYSFGGSVAYEMAQQLQADGQKVALLAILDHTPPPDRYRSALRRP